MLLPFKAGSKQFISVLPNSFTAVTCAVGNTTLNYQIISHIYGCVCIYLEQYIQNETLQTTISSRYHMTVLYRNILKKFLARNNDWACSSSSLASIWENNHWDGNITRTGDDKKWTRHFNSEVSSKTDPWKTRDKLSGYYQVVSCVVSTRDWRN